jgi:hypothetical protein
MAYFDFATKIPKEHRYSTWQLSANIVRMKIRRDDDIVSDIPKANRAIIVPELLFDLGWIYTFQSSLPNDDSFEAEYLLDHSSLHVFDEWTCVMATSAMESGKKAMFDLYFRKEIDLLMAKMILL